MKKITSFLLIIMFSCIIATNVNAAESITLKATKEQVNLGEEITISLDLNIEDSEETSLYAYTAKLSYDKDVFEVIEETDFEESENWSDITYNKNNNKFALINKKGITGENILQIKLKVKDNAIPGKTSITVNNITASDGKKDITLEGKTIDIMVIKDGLAQGESIPVNKTNTITEDNTSIEVGKDFSWIAYVLIVFIIVIFIFTIYYYISSKEEDTPKSKRNTILGTSIMILVILLITTIILLTNKKADVNQDGQVNYEDTKDIMEYLLEIKNPDEDENLSDKDINKDGKITIGDVAASTNQATNQNYEANVNGSNHNNSSNNQTTQPTETTKPEEQYSLVGSTAVSNLTPKKKEEITLDLYIDVTPYTEIEAVEIDGTSYKVAKVENTNVRIASMIPVKAIVTTAMKNGNNHYRVTIPAPITAGVQDISITKVELDNGKKVSVDYKVKVDVLKDEPKVNNFYIDDKKETPEISFDVEDTDGAFKNAKFTITDKNGNTIYESEDIKVGKNTFRANLEDGKTYHYDLVVNYDLDHDYFEENIAQDHKEEKDFIDGIFKDETGDLEFTREYGFSSKNMTVTSEVTSEDDLILSFENGTDSYYAVTHVTIDGKEYEVKLKNGKYSVVLPKGEKGNHSITVESVKLENGHSYPVGQTFNYIYLKDKPTIGEIEASLTDGKLHLSIAVTDSDNTIKSLEVKIKDKDGNVIKTETLTKNVDSETYSKEIEIDASGTYIVEVEVTYDQGNGTEQKVTKTYDKEITEPIKATIIKDQSTMDEFATRNGIVEAIYVIEDNTDKEVTHIIVNGVKIPATKIEDGKYKVVFYAPSERPQNGKVEVIASHLYYVGVVEPIEVNCVTEIEILKQEPTIEELFIDDSNEKPELHFILVDNDHATISGKIIIEDYNGTKIAEIDMDTGNIENKYTLENIEQFKLYTVSIEVTYDLDTDENNNKNQETKTIKSHEFTIQKDYELVLNEFKLVDVKNEKVILQFKSSNKASYDIEKVEVGLNNTRHEYRVTKTGDDTYTIEIPLGDLNNIRTEISLEEIILGNLKEFNKETNEAVFSSLQKYVVLKNKPTATIGDIIVNDEQTEITVKDINIDDSDDTIIDKSIVLKLEDVIVDEIELDDQTEVTFSSIDKNLYLAETYTIEVIADYDAKDGKTHNEEVISQEEKYVTINIVAEVTEASNKVYAEKEETAEITFKIKANTNQDITNIKLDNESLASFEKGENGIYTLTVNVPNKYGLTSYKITEIAYGTHTATISDCPEAEVYVLKDAPTITDITFEDINVPHSYQFTFNDLEGTLIGDAYIKINYKVGFESTQKIRPNEKNIVEIPNITAKNPVTLTFEGTFDRDDDASDEANQYELSEIFEAIELKVIDYTISLNNIKVTNVNQEENNVTFTFEAENNTDYDIIEVKYGDTFYSVTKNGDKYEVTIPYSRIDNEKVDITIRDVKVSNGKIVTLEQPVTFTILKKAPSVTTPTIALEGETIKTTFTITDTDNTILENGLTIELRDENGNVVDSKEVTKDTTEVTFDYNKAGTYKVVILVDYDVADANNHTNVELAESTTITIPIKTRIENSEFKKYPNKNEQMTIKYTITDNTDKDITAIYINSVKTDVTKIEDGVYSVQYKAPATNGIATIKASKVCYGEEEIDVTEKSDEIDVLKTRPYYLNVEEEDFEMVENYADKSLTVKFTVKDPDNATLEGKQEEGYVTFGYGKFKDKNGNASPTYRVGEKTEITFTNVNPGAYMLHIYAPSFDLDSNPNDDHNHYTNASDGGRTIIRIVAFIAEPAQVNLHNITAKTDSKDSTKYLRKQESFKMAFEADTIHSDVDSTNNDCYPEYIRIKGEGSVEKRTFKVVKEGNRYLTELDFVGYDTAGIKEIEMESVILSNKEVISMTDKKLKVDVLKETPQISNFTVDTTGEKPKAKFGFEDSDNAFTDGKIIVKDKNTETETEIPLVKNDNTLTTEYELDLELFEQYEVKLEVNYDLDSNTEDSDNKGTLEEVVENVEIAKSYDLKISDLKVKEVNNVTGKVTIEFKSTNVSEHHIAQIKLVGRDETIAVEYNDETETYTATFAYTDENKTTITIQSVILDNEKQDKTTPTGDLSVEIFKNKPTLQQLEVKYVNEEQKITGTFTLKDEDNVVSKVYAKHTVADGEDEIKEITLSEKSGNIEFENVTKVGTHKVEILADFDALDGKVHDKEVLEKQGEFNDTVEIKANVHIKTKTISNKFPEKGEEIELTYEITTNTNEEISTITIKDVDYNAEKENETDYKVTYTAKETSGMESIDITKVKFSSGTIIDLTDNPHKDTINVLKDKPEIIDFGYTEADDNTITATFKIIDKEDTITAAKVIIVDEDEIELQTKEITVGENSIQFTKNTSDVYRAKIIVDYDLGIKTIEEWKNEHKDQEIYSGHIYASTERRFEMKDIIGSKLYQISSEEVIEKQSLNIKELDNLENFVIKVIMKDMPSFYTTISGYEVEDGKLNLILSNNNITQYVGEAKRDKLIITYGAVQDGIAERDDLSTLINKIKENPNETFTLTRDYDAIGEGGSLSLIDLSVPFTGTINGNGHKIYNLDKPLFNTMENARVENLVLENVTLASANSKASIANTAKNTNLKNVHIKNFNLTTKSNETGGFIGTLTGGNIEECSITNLNVVTAGHIRYGSIVGYMKGGTIKNCYAEGKIISNQTTDGNGIGGILGHGLNGAAMTIENCIAKIDYTWTGGGPRLNGGIIGLTVNNTAVLKNNVSLSTGTGTYKVHGNAINGASINNYELAGTELVSNAIGNVVKVVEKTDVTEEFFKNNAEFNEEIWDLTDASYDKLPTLRNSDPTNEPPADMPENAELYIPNYTMLKKLDNYDKNREIAYSNMYKLIPFYESKYLILDGNKIGLNDELNTKIIKHVLPYNSENKLVTQVNDTNYQNITKIKVIFTDESTKDYELTFDNYKENIATFNIEGLDLKYNFGKFVLKSNLSIANTLIEYINTLDYTQNLDILTTEADSRLYKDHYNEKIKNNISEFVWNFLQYRNDGEVTIENEILNKKIEQELIEQGKIKEILYAYNYYKRWYDFEIGGANVSDIMLYNGKLFANNMNIENLSNEVMTTGSSRGYSYRTTSYTNVFYENNIAKYTKKANIGEFLDYIISTVGGFEDVNDWFTQNFTGILKEIPAKNHPDVEYRAWKHLKRREGYLLAIITLPENAAYMISSPTQFLIGAQRTYIVDPENEAQRQKLMTTINSYATLIGNFYSTVAGFIEPEKLNAKTDMQVDRSYTLNSNGKTEVNSKGSTEEPFHKNFNEAVDFWASNNGSGAYANGSTVFWTGYSALSNFQAWSHETAHNQDSSIFLKGNGRRGEGEDYADGNTAQGGGDGAQNFNLAYEWGLDNQTTTNLTPERINSTEKIEDYYKKMYETWDLLDYLYAKAFLTLSPEEQSKVAVQVDYPNENASKESEKYRTTRWSVKTKEDFENMNLKEIEDLWDKQIVINPGVIDTKTVEGKGKYGSGSIYTTRWYQPNNPYGRPDSDSFKGLAWEMLAIGGYDNGYVTYYSNASTDDLDALRKITKNPEMTWKDYKMGRYELMKNKINGLKYIDANKILQEFIEALKLDAQNEDRNATASMNVKRQNYHYLKRVTNDFRTDPLSQNEIEKTHIKTAEDFKQLITEKPYGYYVLDNDINVSSLGGTEAIIDGCFTGKLDGQGHKIIGNSVPLFDKLYYSYLENLTVEGTNINVRSQQVGGIANLASLVNVSNVTISKGNIISIQDQIGAMFGNANMIMVENVQVVNTSVKGKTRVGGLVGSIDSSSIIKETSVDATVTGNGGGTSAGGLVGWLVNSNVINCYTTGTVSGGRSIGGFVGTATSSLIANSYSSSKVKANSGESGGFIGQAVNNAKLNKSKIINNIALGDCTNAFKFDGKTTADIIENYKNNYEISEKSGTPTANRKGIEFSNRIIVKNIDDVKNISFYTNTLGWSDEIWDFSNVENGGLPKLRNSDPNNITNFIQKK